MSSPIKVLVLSSTRRERDGIAEYTRQVFRPEFQKQNEISISVEHTTPAKMLRAPFQKANIIHVQHEFFLYDRLVGVSAMFYYLWLWLGARFRGYRLVTTTHSSYDLDDLNQEFPHFRKYRLLFPLGRLYLRLHLRWIARLSNRVIVLSRVGLSNLERTVGNSRLQQRLLYIPHGNFSPDIRPRRHGIVERQFGVRPGDTVFTLFGFAFPSKNYELGIAALDILVHQRGRQNARLIIVSGETAKGSFPGGGQGETYIAFLKRLAVERCLADHVSFTGYLRYDDPLLEDIFAVTSVFLFPYRERSFASGALSTVITTGKPLLVSNVRCFQDYEGLLAFKENDAASLADRMVELMDNPGAMTKAEAITRRNAERFSMERIFARHLEVYREAISPKA